jgi:hypothetical protein
VPVDRVEVDGLAELRSQLRQFADRDLPKALQRANKAAAETVAEAARRRAPERSGALRKSIRATASQTGSFVREGNAKVPYASWIDFGGRVGRNRSVSRPFMKGGRILYPAFAERRSAVVDAYDDVIVDLIRRSGLD